MKTQIANPQVLHGSWWFGVTWWGMVASYIVIQIKSKIRHSSFLLPCSYCGEVD